MTGKPTTKAGIRRQLVVIVARISMSFKFWYVFMNRVVISWESSSLDRLHRLKHQKHLKRLILINFTLKLYELTSLATLVKKKSKFCKFGKFGLWTYVFVSPRLKFTQLAILIRKLRCGANMRFVMNPPQYVGFGLSTRAFQNLKYLTISQWCVGNPTCKKRLAT